MRVFITGSIYIDYDEVVKHSIMALDLEVDMIVVMENGPMMRSVRLLEWEDMGVDVYMDCHKVIHDADILEPFLFTSEPWMNIVPTFSCSVTWRSRFSRRASIGWRDSS